MVEGWTAFKQTQFGMVHFTDNGRVAVCGVVMKPDAMTTDRPYDHQVCTTCNRAYQKVAQPRKLARR